MQKVLLKIPYKFQQASIKSIELKVIYFLLKIILSIPIISLFFLLQPDLILKLSIADSYEMLIIQIVNQGSLIPKITILILFGLIFIHLYIISNLKNQRLIKISILFFLFQLVFSNLIMAFLIYNFIYQKNNIFNYILAVLYVIGVEITQFIQENVFISCSYKTRNHFSHKGNIFLYISGVIERWLFYFTLYQSIMNESKTFLGEIFYVYLLIYYLMKLISYFQQRHYINETCNFLQMGGCIISLTLLVISQAYNFYPQQIIEDNFLLMTLVISIFALIAVYSYVQFKKNEYFFKSVQDVVESKKIVDFLEIIFQLWDNRKQHYNYMIILSIKKNHQYKCRNSSCYCSEYQNEKLQEKDMELSNTIFLKGYLKQIIQTITKSIKDQEKILVKLLYFKYQIFNNYITISRNLSRLNANQQKNLILLIGKAILEEKISHYVSEKNQKFQNVSIELPLILNNTLNDLEVLVFNDIHLKNKKWKYLCKGFCKTEDIQSGIIKQIDNLRAFQYIYSENKKSLQKSLAFNSLCLLYFRQIVFFPKEQQQLNKNFRDLKIPIKFNEIVSNKQISKNILDDRVCLLEINLSQYENQESIQNFKITNCNQNIQRIFKFYKSDLISSRIKTIFPKFLWKNEKVLLNKFLNQEDEQYFKQASDKYFVDKNGMVFEALTTLKIIFKNQGVSLIILTFQKQTKNILILNSYGCIESVGETYIHNFGKIYEGIPIQSLFYDDEEYDSLDRQTHLKHMRVKLIDGMNFGTDWKNYLFSLWNHYNKNISQDTKHTVDDRDSLASNRNFKQIQDSNFLIREKRGFLQTQINQMIKQNQKDFSKNHKQISFPVLSTNLTFEKHEIQKFIYYIIKFNEIVKNKQSPPITDLEKNGPLMNDNFHFIQANLNEVKADNHLMGNDSQQQLEKAIDFNPQQYTRAKLMKAKQAILRKEATIESSYRAQSVSYFYEKFTELCFNLFKDPKCINDDRLNYFTAAEVIFLIFIGGLIIGAYMIYYLGLFEVKDIFFADGAVSDNMQLAQFMYNRAMNFKQFKNDTEQFNKIAASALYERQYLYNLTVYDLRMFITEKTKMTSTKFYQYIKVPVTWKFYYTNQTPITIETNQFLNIYYYLARQVQLNVLNSTDEAKNTVSNALQLMMVNLPELKRINHYNLYLYQQMSNSSIDLMYSLLFILGTIHVVLSVAIFLIYYKQKIFRRQQQIRSLSIYSIIPYKIIEMMSKHYLKYSALIKNQKDLSAFEAYTQMQEFRFPISKDIYSTINKNTFAHQQPQTPISVWKLFFILIMVNFIFGFMLLEVKDLFSPISKMMINVNNLMDSQNYLLESYFDFKAKFIIQENFNVDPTFFDSLLQSQQSSEVLFSKIAVDSLELFSQYDDTYKSDFITLLIDDICELDKDLITPQEYEKCISYFKLEMLDNGVIMGMNFFTRKVRSLIEEYKKKFQLYSDSNGLPANERENLVQMLRSLEFRQVDESIIYMFKMYQGTQARIYTSLQKVIIQKMNSNLWLIIIELLITAVAFPLFLVKNFSDQKIQLSKLYISFVLIPTPISKMIKAFTGKIEDILEYNKDS